MGNLEFKKSVLDWCKANRQWTAARNIQHARYQLNTKGTDHAFWAAVIAQFIYERDE